MKKVRWELRKNVTSYFEQILEAIPHDAIAVQPLTSNIKDHPSKMNKTLLEKQGQTHKWCSMNLLHMDMPVLADKQELIYISSVQTQDVVWKTCWEPWMIGMDGLRELGKSVLLW